MTADPILALFLPITPGITILDLGLSLTSADFLRMVRYPKPVLVGLVCQIVLLPMVRLLIVQGLALEVALAVGMMLLATSPGGTTTSLYSYLVHGDVVLNITSTMVNSMIAILITPLIVDLSLRHFTGDGQAIPLQFGRAIQVFVIVLSLVAIGMLVRDHLPAVAGWLQKPVRTLSVLLLLATILLAPAKDWQTFVIYASVAGLAALAFNLSSLAVDYRVSHLLCLSKVQAVVIGMKIGVYDGTLATALALSPNLLNNSTMAIPSMIYEVLTSSITAAFGWWVSHGHQAVLALVMALD